MRSRAGQCWLAALILAFPFLTGLSFAGVGHLPAIPTLSQSELEKFDPIIRERVEKGYEEAQANPTDAEANGRLGMILHACDHYEHALVCYQRAALLKPESFRWNYYLGSLQHWLGKEALATLRKAVQLNPDYLPARLKLGEALLARRNWEETREIFEAVLKKDADSPIAHYGLGRIQSAQGEPGAAAESYRKACQLSPSFGTAHYALAMTYRDLGKAAKAKEHFSLFQRNKQGRPPLEDPLANAIVALKSGAHYHLNRGVRLQASGQLRQAIAEFERALEFEPDYARVHEHLLSGYLALEQLGKAEEHYHTAVKLNPDMYEVHHNFGILLTLRGKPGEAVDAFRRAVGINPYYAESHTNLGLLLSDQGQLTEAVKHLRLAIELKPNFRLPHFALGHIVQRQGKHMRKPSTIS